LSNAHLKYVRNIPGSEMIVQGNGANIATGDTSPAAADHTDFGSVTLGQSRTRTFTIINNGLADLTISSVSLEGAAAGDFSVSGITTPATVLTDESVTFQVTFVPTVSGTRAATVSIANNDPDKNPYTFAIQGESASITEKFYLPLVITKN